MFSTYRTVRKKLWMGSSKMNSCTLFRLFVCLFYVFLFTIFFCRFVQSIYHWISCVGLWIQLFSILKIQSHWYKTKTPHFLIMVNLWKLEVWASPGFYVNIPCENNLKYWLETTTFYDIFYINLKWKSFGVTKM